MKHTLKYIILILIALATGFLIKDYFFDFSLSQIANNKTKFVTHNINDQFYSVIVFIISIGFIPILYAVIQKIVKINFIYRGLISLFLIISNGILFWGLKIFLIKTYLRQPLELNTPDKLITADLNFYSLNFEYNLFSGFIFGTFLSVLIFLKRKK